jgi:transcriptional regulator with XRE-family HTH domain
VVSGASPAVGERFGENLRRVRRREGLSQEQLAVGAGLHRTEVGLLERSGRTCRIDTLRRLAGAMAVGPGELLDGIVWVPAPETEGTFTFNLRPFRDARRQISTPRIEQSEIT